jgi:hypothetical protein
VVQTLSLRFFCWLTAFSPSPSLNLSDSESEYSKLLMLFVNSFNEEKKINIIDLDSVHNVFHNPDAKIWNTCTHIYCSVTF